MGSCLFANIFNYVSYFTIVLLLYLIITIIDNTEIIVTIIKT